MSALPHIAAPAQTRAEWVPLATLYAAFPGGKQAARRWWQRQNNAHVHRDGRTLLVARDCRLPDGTPAGLWHRHPAGEGDPGANSLIDGLIAPPGALASWSAADRDRFLATHELRRRLEALQREHPTLSRDACIRFLSRRDADWLRSQHMGRSRGAILRALRRITPGSPDFDGNVDGRGSTRAEEFVDEAGEVHADRRLRAIDPELLALFRALVLNENKLRVAEAWRFCLGEARRATPPRPWPSLRAMQLWVQRNIPKPVQVMAREGDARYTADCEPKLRRDYESIAPGDIFCLDGRTLDFQARVPAARGGWRRCRLVVTGVLDLGSRKLVGFDVRDNEHADGILCGLKMAIRSHGVPRELLVDNGSGYVVAVGSTFKQRIPVLCDSLGITLTNARPHEPWAKPIESFWRRAKDEFDRWIWSFWGGQPGERPERANELTQVRLDRLPKLDDVRDLFGRWLEVYHATPHGGEGMFNLSPQVKFEQSSSAVRRLDDATLDLLLSTLKGPVRVTRDGVLFESVRYGHFAPEVHALIGRQVWLRFDPETRQHCTLCDQDGRPLEHPDSGQPVVLAAGTIFGTSSDQVREAHRARVRARRAVREAAGARDFLLKTPPQQIMQVRAEHARAALAEQRAALPQPPAPAVTLVRPDLAEPARRIRLAKQKQPQRNSSLSAPSACSANQSGFALLASDSPLPARRAAADVADLYATLGNQLAADVDDRNTSVDYSLLEDSA